MGINFGSNTDTQLYFGTDTAPTIYLGETLVYGGSWKWTLEYRRNGETVEIIPITELGLTQYTIIENDKPLFKVYALAEDGSKFWSTVSIALPDGSMTGNSQAIPLGYWEYRRYIESGTAEEPVYSDDFYVTYERTGKIIVDRTEHVIVPVFLRPTGGTAWLTAGTYPYENLDTGAITSGTFEGQEIELAYLNPDANLDGTFNLYLAGYTQSGTLKGAFTLSGDGQSSICKLLYKRGHSMPARVLPADAPVPSSGPISINAENHTLTLAAGTYQYYDWETGGLTDITIEKTDNIYDPSANMDYRYRNIYNTLIQIKDYQGTWLTACDNAEEMSSLSVDNNFVYGGYGTPALQYRTPTGIRFNATFDEPTGTEYLEQQSLTVNSSLFNLTSSSITDASITLKCYDEDDNLLYTKHGGFVSGSTWDDTKAVYIADNDDFRLEFTQGIAVKRFEFEWINMSGRTPSSDSKYYVLKESSFNSYQKYHAGVFPVYFDYYSLDGEVYISLIPQAMMEGVPMVGKLVYEEGNPFAIQALEPD